MSPQLTDKLSATLDNALLPGTDSGDEDLAIKQLMARIKHRKRVQSIRQAKNNETFPPPGLPHPPAYRASVVHQEKPGDAAPTTAGPVNATGNRTPPVTVEEEAEVPDVPRDPPLPFTSAVRCPERNSRLPRPRKPTQVEDAESVIELSSSSEEDLVNLPLSKGDSVYRGSRNRSRVDSIQVFRDTSPPVTRRAARMRAAAHSQENLGDDNVSPSTPRTRKRNHHALAPSDDDDDHLAVKVRKTERHAGRTTLQRLSRTAPSRLKRGGRVKLQPSPEIDAEPTHNLFVDDEALDDASGADSGPVDAMSLDDYDSSDSFIDDSPLQERPKSKSKSRFSPAPVRSDIPQRNYTRPARTSDQTGTKLQSPAGTPASVRDEHLTRSSVKVEDEDLSNPSHRSEMSKFKQLVDRNTRATPPQTPLRRAKHINKGKNRAPPSEDEAMDLGDPDDIQYNSFSEGELEMLLEGIRRSRAAKAAARARGESSKNPDASTTARDAMPATPASGPITPPTSSNPISSPINASGGSASSALSASTSHSTSKGGSSPTSIAGRCRCPPLPEQCQVTDPALQDPRLATTYSTLVPLISGELVSWSDLVGPGQVTFGAWPDQCPDMDIELALNAITFIECGRFVNPSRASPMNVEVLPQTATSNRFYLSRNGEPLIGVSCIYLEHSHLLFETTSGMIQKFIRGIFHSQEWERFVAWICMVFGHRRLHAQLLRDALQFSTRPRFENKGESGKKTKGMFTNSKSPSTKSNPTPNKLSADALALPTEGQVPVYDARGSTFNFHTDLPNVASLPRWSEEIPAGSFVVVGYTNSLYRSAAGKWTVGFNIQFAVIVGVPAADSD
ncbi:hypothetical protein MD484_g5657, partial [Candolleomyces efflorescens]